MNYKSNRVLLILIRIYCLAARMVGSAINRWIEPGCVAILANIWKNPPITTV